MLKVGKCYVVVYSGNEMSGRGSEEGWFLKLFVFLWYDMNLLEIVNNCLSKCMEFVVSVEKL